MESLTAFKCLLCTIALLHSIANYHSMICLHLDSFRYWFLGCVKFPTHTLWNCSTKCRPLVQCLGKVATVPESRTLLQAASIAARRHETADASGKSLAISDADGVSDAAEDNMQWQDSDLGRRMLEKMGQAIPALGAFGKKALTSDQVVQPPGAPSDHRGSARKSDSADDEDDVWGRLLSGGLSQKDIEWVRIKSFMDEKKK